MTVVANLVLNTFPTTWPVVKGDNIHGTGNCPVCVPSESKSLFPAVLYNKQVPSGPLIDKELLNFALW